MFVYLCYLSGKVDSAKLIAKGGIDLPGKRYFTVSPDTQPVLYLTHTFSPSTATA